MCTWWILERRGLEGREKTAKTDRDEKEREREKQGKKEQRGRERTKSAAAAAAAAAASVRMAAAAAAAAARERWSENNFGFVPSPSLSFWFFMRVRPSVGWDMIYPILASPMTDWFFGNASFVCLPYNQKELLIFHSITTNGVLNDLFWRFYVSQALHMAAPWKNSPAWMDGLQLRLTNCH